MKQWARHLGNWPESSKTVKCQFCKTASYFPSVLASPGTVRHYGLHCAHWFGLQWTAWTIVWSYWNFAVTGDNQCSHFLLTLCNNYYHHKSETTLHYSHILPLYCYACAFPDEPCNSNVIINNNNNNIIFSCAESNGKLLLNWIKFYQIHILRSWVNFNLLIPCSMLQDVSIVQIFMVRYIVYISSCFTCKEYLKSFKILTVYYLRGVNGWNF